MIEVLFHAGCFISIIFLGYFLRRIGFFEEKDFYVLSKIVLKITLPAAIVTSFASKEMDISLLALAVLGLGCGAVYIFLMYLINRKNGVEQQAFEIVNTSGYSIGTFTLPFVQGFLGPMGVIATSIFDVGNACISLGGAYSIASIIKEGKSFSFGKIAKALSKSVAFDCYLIMIFFAFTKFSLPSPILSFAKIIANANAFMAMFMIGLGFKLSGTLSLMKKVIKMLFIRYGAAIIFALSFYFLLPFSLEIRQTLVLLVFSPFPSSAPAFTGSLKGDVGLASAVNSISIIISIVCIVLLLLIM